MSMCLVLLALSKDFPEWLYTIPSLNRWHHNGLKEAFWTMLNQRISGASTFFWPELGPKKLKRFCPFEDHAGHLSFNLESRRIWQSSWFSMFSEKNIFCINRSDWRIPCFAIHPWILLLSLLILAHRTSWCWEAFHGGFRTDYYAGHQCRETKATAMLQVLVPAFSKQQAPARVVLLRTRSFSQTQFYGRKPDQAFPVGLFMVNIDMFQN